MAGVVAFQLISPSACKNGIMCANTSIQYSKDTTWYNRPRDLRLSLAVSSASW